MKKRLFSIAICFCLMFACLFSFTACGNKMTLKDAEKKIEPTAVHLNALAETMSEEAENRQGQESGILFGASQGVYEFLFSMETLAVLSNYKAYNTVVGAEMVKKNGNTYTMIVEEGVTATVKVSATENSIKLDASTVFEEETTKAVSELSFAKNYLKFVLTETEQVSETETETDESVAEIRVVGSDAYILFYTDMDKTDEVIDIIKIKYNFTITSETVMGEKRDVATINSFEVDKIQDEEATASIKKADWTNTMPEEGVISYEAPVAA